MEPVIETEGRQTQSLILKNGSPVGFAEYGDPKGFPVLALHGVPACRLMFAVADKSAKQLNLRIIAPDRPGYGRTPSDQRATLQSRTEWLAQFVDALRVNRCALFAISGGSPYAVSFASFSKDRVQAVVLVSPMGPIAEYAATPDAQAEPLSFFQEQFFINLPPRLRLKQPIANLGAWAFRKIPDFFSGLLPKIANAHDAIILSRPEMKLYLNEMTLEALSQGGRGCAQDWEIFSRPWGVTYKNITMPVEIWQGTTDPVVPPQVVEWLACQLPTCKLHLIKDAGHFWIFDHVNEVLSTLAQHLSQRSSM
ncbi:MAG: alpha/beta fold hydrolase [Hyphomicrobium sp.]